MISTDEARAISGSNVGLCVKDRNLNIVFQNDVCRRICGERNPETCKMCLSLCQEMQEASVLAEGLHGMTREKINNHDVDIAFIAEPDSITSLFYVVDNSPERTQRIDSFLKKRGLTKSEVEVFKMVLGSLNNQEISAKLFIAKATLRTHLTRIYKKLPAFFRRKDFRQ